MSDRRHPNIIRTERGLTIAGTRITLYDILQYLHDSRWTEESARDILHLTRDQMRAALNYISSAHRAEVAAEYRDVVAQNDEICRY